MWFSFLFRTNEGHDGCAYWELWIWNLRVDNDCVNRSSALMTDAYFYLLHSIDFYECFTKSEIWESENVRVCATHGYVRNKRICGRGNTCRKYNWNVTFDANRNYQNDTMKYAFNILLHPVLTLLLLSSTSDIQLHSVIIIKVYYTYSDTHTQR